MTAPKKPGGFDDRTAQAQGARSRTSPWRAGPALNTRNARTAWAAIQASPQYRKRGPRC